MYMAEPTNFLVMPDFLGRTVLVETHITVRQEQLREELRDHAIDIGSGHYQVAGFVLGKLVDISIHGPYWVRFPWKDSPIQVQEDTVLGILLDDEAEPDTFNGLPRLVP